MRGVARGGRGRHDLINLETKTKTKKRHCYPNPVFVQGKGGKGEESCKGFAEGGIGGLT